MDAAILRFLLVDAAALDMYFDSPLVWPLVSGVATVLLVEMRADRRSDILRWDGLSVSDSGRFGEKCVVRASSSELCVVASVRERCVMQMLRCKLQCLTKSVYYH